MKSRKNKKNRWSNRVVVQKAQVTSIDALFTLAEETLQTYANTLVREDQQLERQKIYGLIAGLQKSRTIVKKSKNEITAEERSILRIAKRGVRRVQQLLKFEQRLADRAGLGKLKRHLSVKIGKKIKIAKRPAAKAPVLTPSIAYAPRKRKERRLAYAEGINEEGPRRERIRV